MGKKDINQGICCNVRNCVFNERGCDCNLERVNISRGEGGHHYCKSYVSLSDDLKPEMQEDLINTEAGEEYFDYKNLIDYVEKTDDEKEKAR